MHPMPPTSDPNNPMRISFGTHSPRIGGSPKFLFSGEFHYFRVPRNEWLRRMELLKAAGGNCIATYVPWCVHEPEEGRILFGDRPERDLEAFLETARAAGLPVLLRPGPYQYSELTCGGLPSWLLRDYPCILAKHPDGRPIDTTMSVSYMHPVFLEKARRYFRAVAERVRPHLAENGGAVSLVQVDNETGGIHLWFGGADANRDTFGMGREDGRFARFLAARYGTVEAMNTAHGTRCASFADALPVTSAAPDASPEEERRCRDFLRCYNEQLLEYLGLVASWLREDGIDAPLVQNSGTVDLLHLYEGLRESNPHGILVGYDHYYTLGPSWSQGCPTPRYARQTRLAVDRIRALGYVPIGFELPGGSPSDVPPILRNDLLACWLSHVAAGARGLNLYVFTGGPNFGDTGQTADIYDYNALVHADGTLNETYDAMRVLGEFLARRADLLETRRAASVQIGFEWDALRFGRWAPKGGISGDAAGHFAAEGLFSALANGRYPAEFVDLSRPVDASRPLLVAAPSVMSAEAQRNIVDFLERGGRLFLAPDAPTLGSDLAPCTILRDYLALPASRPARKGTPPVAVDGCRVFGIDPRCAFDPPASIPSERRFTQTRTGETFGWWQPSGRGLACLFGATFQFALFGQAEMLERILAAMGAEPVADSSNRNVQVEAHVHPDGHRTLFLLNLHSSPQSTRLALFRHGVRSAATDIALGAMQVAVADEQPDGSVSVEVP